MNRLDQKLEQLKLENRSGLVCYFTAGDPNFTASCRLLSQLGQAGADIIEVGIPFSDPVADGEIIQAAHLRALDAGQTVKQTIELVKVIRLHDDQTPIIFMTYLNPMMQYGFETLIAETENLIDGISVHDKFHRTLVLSGFFFLKIASTFLNKKVSDKPGTVHKKPV